MATIEQVITYWNNRPCNIMHSDKEIGTKEYFEEVTKRKYMVEPHILDFADFKSYQNKKVLEVGCGIGTAGQSFIENGAIYSGLDISSKSIDIAKKRAEIFNLNGVFSVANIEEYSSDEKFDLIYSFGVLHHTPIIRKAIKNIYNQLQDGGEFKLMLYAKNSLKMFKINSGLEQYEAQAGVPIADTFTNEEIYDLLKDFKNINIMQTHIFPYKIEEYKQYKYVKEDYFECMSSDLFKCLEKNLGWHLCIRCNK